MFTPPYVLFSAMLIRLFVPPPVHLIYGPNTTVLNGPRYPDGTINYVAALNQRLSNGVTRANNAYVEIALTMPSKAKGAHSWGWPSKTFRRQVFKRLDMKPADNRPIFVFWKSVAQKAGLRKKKPVPMKLPEKLKKKLSPELLASLKKNMQSHVPYLPERATRAPWSAKDMPVVVKWLKANRKVMARIRRASKKPRYYAPLIPTPGDTNAPPVVSIGLPELGYVRSVARCFTADAERAIGAGDLKAAWSDALVLKRLGRLLFQQPMLISNLVGISVDAMGRNIVCDIAASPAMTPALAKKMLADLDKLGSMPSLARSIDTGERFSGLDSLQSFWKRNAKLEMLGKSAGIFRSNYFNINVALREFNRWYDRLVREAKADDCQTYKRLAEREDAIFNRLVRRQQWLTTNPLMWVELLLSPADTKQSVVSHTLSDLISGILLPALGAADNTMWKSRMANDLSRVALALGGYRAAHGQYPQKLQALAPKFLDHVPDDLFIDKPLHYRLEKNKKDAGTSAGVTAVVYSVGTNQKDDGGTGESFQSGDIIVRLDAPKHKDEQAAHHAR